MDNSLITHSITLLMRNDSESNLIVRNGDRIMTNFFKFMHKIKDKPI
jgi:hypothetical protein